jgi:glycosyltransferase involved in cell wall biosynthesis
MPSANVRRSFPSVTVLVPARNEERHIEGCLEAIAAQDYDHDQLELVVVDGGSTDDTAERARLAIERLGLHGKVVDNPIGTTPSNLNVGLAHASGEYLCRVDARSLIPVDYVSRCVDLLSRLHDVAVVGGAQVAVPPSDSVVGIGIARALNNRWGMGLSRYRRAAASGRSDTVYLGSFRTADLRSVGGWDERLGTNQDFDLNRRLSHRGAVWFDAALTVGYIPRSNLAELYRQYRRFGQWKVRYWRMTHDRPRGRQLALIAAPPLAALAFGAALVRNPEHRALLLAVGAAATVAVEVAGAKAPATRSVPAHLTGVAAMGAVATGWLAGIAEEALRVGRG